MTMFEGFFLHVVISQSLMLKLNCKNYQHRGDPCMVRGSLTRKCEGKKAVKNTVLKVSSLSFCGVVSDHQYIRHKTK